MKEQAEFGQDVMRAEAELIVPATPETTTNELNESASRAAAMIALNEAAAQKDWDQNRIDAAQANIDAKYSQAPVSVAETPVSEAPRADSLVGAIDDARTTQLTEERSHAAALAAADQAAKRAELLNIEDTAAHKDWDQDRIDTAKAQVEAKYS